MSGMSLSNLSMGMAGPTKGVGALVPPPGFVFFIKPDGTYWTNASGAYYLKAVA